MRSVVPGLECLVLLLSIFTQSCFSDSRAMRKQSRKQVQENYAPVKSAMRTHSTTFVAGNSYEQFNPYSQHMLMAVGNEPRIVCNDTTSRRMISVGVEGFGSHVFQALNVLSYCERERCAVEIYWCRPYSCYAGDSSRGANGWLQFFQPVCTIGQHLATPRPWRGPAAGDSSDLDRIVDAHRPWYHETVETEAHGIFGYYIGPWRKKQQDVYDENWYASQRSRGARLLARYVRLRPHVISAANAAWRAVVGTEGGRVPKVLGLHMRGTDVLNIDSRFADRVRTEPDAFLPVVKAYLDAEPQALVFVATDDEAMLERAASAWPPEVARVLRWRNITRSPEGFRGQCEGNTFEAGLDSLIDVLLLSRCNYLVHTASSIPELAIMFNPSLHSNSFNLRFSSGQEHNWIFPFIKEGIS